MAQPAPAKTVSVPLNAPAGRLGFLSPDWLPKALIAGDAAIAGASVFLAYWYHHNIDPIRPVNAGELPVGPYLAAIPVVMVTYVVALAATHQYQSWRGRTLVDLLLQLYSGVGLASGLSLIPPPVLPSPRRTLLLASPRQVRYTSTSPSAAGGSQ